MKLFGLLISVILGSGIFAATTELERILAENDADGAIRFYQSKPLSDADTEALVDWFSTRPIEYRKRLTAAIHARGATDLYAGKHINAELLRLIKDNKVEDDVNYTSLCLQAAAVNKNPDLIYVITPFIVHPQARLRADANKAIALKQDERAYPVIGHLLAEDNAIDKIYAMETLLALKDARAVPLLLQQISNPNKNVRYFALKTLEAINSDKAQYGIIHLAQADPEQEVRLRAIKVLENFHSGAVMATIQKLISDPDLAIRKASLNFALKRNDKWFAHAISEQLATEPDGAHKLALLRALPVLGSGGGMRGVLALLQKESDPQLLLWSAFACNQFSETRCAEPLALLVVRPGDRALVLECLVALGTFRQRQSVQAIFSVLNDTKNPPEIRSAALVALRQFDSAAVIGPLTETYSREKLQPLRAHMKLLFTELVPSQHSPV
jgi:HEAT repeat protein